MRLRPGGRVIVLEDGHLLRLQKREVYAFLDALKLLEEMHKRETFKMMPQIFTMLTNGARALRLFDEMELCGVIPDHGAHMGLCIVRARYLHSDDCDVLRWITRELVWSMLRTALCCVSFVGLITSRISRRIYTKTICFRLVPRTMMTMLLMKFFRLLPIER